jgi:hypothetical protein
MLPPQGTIARSTLVPWQCSTHKAWANCRAYAKKRLPLLVSPGVAMRRTEADIGRKT